MRPSSAITTEVPSWFPTPAADAVTAAASSPSLRLIRLPDSASVAELVASLLLEEALRPPKRPLGLATGRTMHPVYAALARQLAGRPQADAMRLRRHWLSFNLDDYVGLDPADPRCFAAEMAQRLTEPLGLDPARVRLPAASADRRGSATEVATAAETEASRYAGALAAAGGIGLQLLGLGLNGHLGFNEPPCSPEMPCRLVALSAATRQQNAAAFGGDPAAVPRWAITLGLREILAAQRILLVVTGVAKAEVLSRALQQPPTPELPASWLQCHPCVTVIADEQACAAMPQQGARAAGDAMERLATLGGSAWTQE